MWLLVLALLLQQPRPPVYFQSPYTQTDLRGKQAVVETSAGAFVIQLLPDAAPNHVGLFVKLAREGAYAGTIFHRVLRYGLIQGGDPLSRDPARMAQYGQGGLNQLRFEPNAEKHTAGAVSAVLQPGQRDSAGAQFFVCISDQPTLDGQYTVFGRVVEGLEIAQAISAAPASAAGLPATRIEIKSVTIRDTPPEPFVSDPVATLASHRATLETTMGEIELEMLPDKAPETVRRFLRLAQAAVYDGTAVHRVVPNFVIQTGALAFRTTPLSATQQRLVVNMPPEFTDTPNVPGIVSIARGDDPNSGSTSFFICTGECRSLDGKFAVFARVVRGMDVLTAIAGVPVDGETPRTPVTLTRVRLSKVP
jgi:cyclophilin family peptidyl-prolyl cis-trans isomerase